MQFQSIMRLMLVSAASFMVMACGDDVTNVAAAPPPAPSAQQVYDRVSIPAGVWLDGVNDINFYSTLEGLVMQSEDSSAKAAVAGGLNGGGTGNKAYVGLNKYGGTLVSDLRKLEFEARLDRGTPFSFINMQIDCDGDGNWVAGTDAVVVVDSESVQGVSLTFDLTQGLFKRFVINSTDPVFKSVGAVCGLPSHISLSGAPLSSLPATAKFFNGVVTDGGMPRATNMAAILFIMNDSGSRVSRQVTLRELKLNDASYKFYQSN